MAANQTETLLPNLVFISKIRILMHLTPLFISRNIAMSSHLFLTAFLNMLNDHRTRKARAALTGGTIVIELANRKRDDFQRKENESKFSRI